MTVHILVEGGGPQKRTQTECRKAFRIFLERAIGDNLRPRISACGSRNEAYTDFCRSLRNDRNTVAILLVDSEDPVIPGQTPREHLRKRDRWTEPMPEGQVHLMVQCMESWFLADRSTLETYYGAEFRPNRLPANERIEEISKQDVMRGLAAATKDTGKGRYHKTRHGFAILECIDPALVRSRSEHAKEFLDFLLSRLTAREDM